MRIPTDYDIARELRAMIVIGVLMLVAVTGLVMYAAYRDEQEAEERRELIIEGRSGVPR